MGWFGRDPDKCNEDVRREVAEGQNNRPTHDRHIYSRKEYWHTQRDKDRFGIEDPDY